MNLYVRYFDHEKLAMNLDEVVEFLSGIEEISVDRAMIDRIVSFTDSTSVYPFRLKVSLNNYILFLKTEAASMEEFKEMEKMRKDQKAPTSGGGSFSTNSDRKRSIIEILNDERPGWYEGTLIFKRVVPIPQTSKFQYKDVRFTARMRAISGMDCYNRIVEHLKNRQDVDHRSQFPAAKSNNFEYRFLGENPEA